MRKNLLIQKIMKSRMLFCTMIMIGFMILVAASSAYGQTVCSKDAKGNCVGVCPPLYNGDGTVAGTPVCEKVGNNCVCSHLDIACNTCTVVQRVCKGKCAPLYRSKDDAKHERKPVKGICQFVLQGTGTAATKVCKCRYTL